MKKQITNFLKWTGMRPNQTNNATTNALRYAAMLLCVLMLGVGQMWGTVTVGLTTSLSTTSGKGGSEVYSNGSNAYLTVTKSAAGVGTGSDSIVSYTTGDKALYVHSSTAQYANFNYNCKKSFSGRSATRYAGYSVAVASGYKFSLSSLSATIAAGSNMSWRVEIVNSSGTVLYSSGDMTMTSYNSSSSTNYTINPTLSGTAACQNLTGTFYVRAYHWVGSTGKYWCYPTLTITGTVEAANPTWYTLSYDANGGSGSIPAQEFISGTTVYAGQNTSFTPPSGKIFKCWNTAPNGGGTSYSEGASFTLSGNTTLYAQWITASTGSTYCINMYNLSVSDQMKYFTHSGYNDMYILDLEVPSYNTGGNNFWVGNNGSWYNDGLGNSNAKSANEKLEDLCLKGNRSTKLGTASQGVLARFFVYDNSASNNLYIEFTPKQYSLIWGSGGDWSPVKLYPSGYQNEWTSEVVTLTSDQISSYNYYVGILKADNGVAYWYKSNTLSVGSMGTYNKRTDTWGGNVSTLSAGDKGFFRMWSDATGYDNWRCHFVPVYTLSYNANSGSGAPATVYVPAEGDDSHRTVKLSTTEPTRSGYSFEGWATSSSRASSGTVDYAAGAYITVSADTELFAVWSCITPDAPTADKITVTPSCAGTGATFSANTTGIPSYVTWYWQTAANGTNTTYPASSGYTTATSAGSYTMYLRAKNTACGEWSSSASSPSKSVKVKTPVTASWSTAPANGTADGDMDASLTTNYASGVVYTSSNTDVATVSGDGTTTCSISYKAAGTARITATVTGAGDDYCSTASCYTDITVVEPSYSVTYDGDNCTKKTGGTSATRYTDFTATFQANTHYTLPNTITVTIGGDEVTEDTEYTWSISAGVGTVSIDGDYITGAVVITVDGVADQFDVTLSYDDDEVSKKTGSTGTNAATYGTDYVATFQAKSGYTLQDDVTVTIGESTATKDSEYTWAISEGVGTLTITGSSITDDIEVEIDADVDVTTYSVTYAAGVTLTSGDTPDDVTDLDNGDKVTVADNTGSMVYTGYTFRGWTDGTTFYLPGNTITISGSDVDLTAVWESSGTTVAITHFATSNSTSSVPDGQARYFYGYPNSTMAEGDKILITTSGNSDCRGQDEGVIMRLNYGCNIRVYNGSSNTNYTGITAISFKWRFRQTGNSGKTEETSSYTVKVVGASTTTVANAVSITGKSNDDYRTVNITGLSNLSGYVEITAGGTSSNHHLYLDDIAITCSGAASNFYVAFDNKTGFEGTTTLPDTIKGVPTGKKILQPTAPTASGYIFGGWYTDSSCTSAWNWGSSTVSKDTTLYAKWTAKTAPTQYTVTIDAATVCSGSSTNIKMASSQSGVSYQLYKGEDKVGDAKAGGSALTWSSISATGTYKVMAVENATYAAREMSNTVSLANYDAVSIKTHPTSEIAATVDVGSDMSVVLNTGTFNNATYTWQTCTDATPSSASDISSGSQYANYNTATMTFTPAAEGTYYFRCKVTDDCGTTVYSNVATVTASDLFDITMGTHTNGSFTIKVGSADAVSTSTAASAGATIAIVATPSSGYAFKNWEILDSSSDDITTTVGASATSASTSFTMPSEAVTINAVFVATHTLTVSVSGGVGGSVSPTSTTVGETLTQSITATPGTGYNFSSWAVSGTGASLSSTTTNPTTFTMGTANATVTATFSAKTYSITLDAGNGTGGSESVTMTYNSASHTSITAPTLTGYSLVGWYTGAGGTGTMIMNASGTLQASVDGYTGAGGIWTKDATCTLYAKYAAVYPEGYLYITDVMSTPEAKAGYTITMTKNSANYNGTLGSTLQTNRAGYEYWADATGSSGTITLSFSDALPASATAGGLIIDVWWGADSNNRTTSIALNGGSAELLDAANTSTGDRDIVKKATYTTELKSLSSITLSCSGGHTVWFRIGIKDRPGYLLTYDDGDGSGAPSASYQPNATITLSETVPTRSGYVFSGWQVDGSGTVYQPGDEFSMPASTVTLVAKWTAVCMSFTAATSGSKDVAAGTTKEISTASGGYASTLSGGSMSFYGRVGKIGNNDTYGLVFDSKDDELLTVTLTDAMLEAGAIIILDCYSVNTNSTTVGFTLSGNACAEGNYTTTAAAYQRFTRTYVVTEDDGIDGTSSFTIEGATTNKIYLKGMQIAGCSSCTGINPTLSYSATTLYAFGGTPREARPTLTGNTGNGTVAYSSSNTSVVTVDSETGVVTAVGAGTATVTAVIEPNDGYCGAIKSVNFTVPALVTQTINLNSAWSTVPNMTFNDPTSTLTKNANIAATGYSINESDNKSGLSSKITGVPSSTSKDDDYYMSLSFNSPSHDVRFGEVVVPIQPITNSASAIVTLSDGTTTITSNEEADIAASKTKTVRFTFSTEKTLSAGTITLKIFVYDQTGDKGFRLGSPILVNGGVIVPQVYTDGGSTGVWSDPANWNGGALPTIYHDVVLEKPVEVDIAHATAKSIVLDQNGNTGKLTIQPNKGLEVASTITKTTDGSNSLATIAADLVLESSSAGNATLIFENDGNAATVAMFSKAKIVDEDTWNWQYIGSPFTTANALNNYYGSYMYQWNDGWKDVTSSSTINPWVGYSITNGTADATYVMEGTLVPTETTEISIPAKPSTVIANSWTAPIYIPAMTSGFASGTEQTVYLYNTGFSPDGTSWATTGSEEARYAAGTYLSVPCASAVAIETPFIAPMQGFVVKNTTSPRSAITLTLNYATMVRPTISRDVIGGPMHAPRRLAGSAEDVQPEVLKLTVSGTNYDDVLYLLERVDFTTGFDNGWDGTKMGDVAAAPRMYTKRDDGVKEAVSAVPDLEGRVITFRAGADADYTFSFKYSNEADALYLYDMEAQVYTRIMTGNSYTFTTIDKAEHPRFILTRNAPTITTGVENSQAEAKAIKFIENDKLYIFRGGRIYSAEGALVK